VHIHQHIKHARVGLFGKDLSDSAIYYWLRQERERAGQLCSEPEDGPEVVVAFPPKRDSYPL
jgi:hypothetical protein